MHCKASHSSRAATLSHVLDPAYSATSSPSTESSLSSVYRDCRGDLHDPDYHHFEMPSSPHSHIRSKAATPSPTEERFAWELEAEALGYEDEEERPAPHPRRSSLDSTSSSYTSSVETSSPHWSLDPWLLELDSEDYSSEEYSQESAPSSPESEPASLALRKQWLAVSLRVKVKVFRAKKRISGHNT